jgi:predicted MPP superfamily phosphohydrolase
LLDPGTPGFMEVPPMPRLEMLFWLLAAATFVGIPSYAWRVRGRGYATYGLVILTVAMPGAVLMHARLRHLLGPALAPWIDVAFLYSMAAAALHLLSLVTPRLRTPVFRYAISIPGMTFVAGGGLSTVWLLVLLLPRLILWSLGFTRTLDVLAWADLVPIGIAVASVLTSSRLVEEVVRVAVAEDGPAEVSRLPVERHRRRRSTPEPLPSRPLRIVQIADPHLGPWQPVKKLRQQVEALIDHDPDLVLLTGDFLTMEGMGTPGALAAALEPLRRLPGRCYAAFGNHDHESPDEVLAGLHANGVHVLIDEEVSVETAAGAVQIVGADFIGRGRKEHLEQLLARFPRRDGQLRLLLLHDPSAFKHVPKGDVDLTLSGHTHGGQLGLVSFGWDWTVLRRTPFPDHGLWGHGSNRLYVHRGTGFYGFPLRIGVPGEASCLEVVFERTELSAGIVESPALG